MKNAYQIKAEAHDQMSFQTACPGTDCMIIPGLNEGTMSTENGPSLLASLSHGCNLKAC